MSASRRVADVLFRLLIPAGGLFVITVLSLVMLPFSSTEAPLARFLDARGGLLIVLEVAALGVIGLGALVADRVATLSEPPAERPADMTGAAETTDSPKTAAVDAAEGNSAAVADSRATSAGNIEVGE